MSHGPERGGDGRSIALNPQMRVVCLLCGRTAAEDTLFWGCTACGAAAPLTLAYPAPPRVGRDFAAAVDTARDAFSVFAPPPHGSTRRPPTPLDAAPGLGPNVYVKQEAFSLTASHKDRYHAVAAPVARLLGLQGIVASSTGNHGVSAAAHAAANGLHAVIFCHSETPPGLLRAIAAFGGVALQVDSAAQRRELVGLVADGWFPATSLDPALTGAGNPFGPEGYKSVAYEVVEQLGAIPDAVFVPTAGGDTFFGIMKGFVEIADLSGAPMPVVIAIQPEGANALSQSVAAGRPVTVPRPASIALSLADPETGRHAIMAIDRWGGQVLDVTEAEIRAALATLASIGIYSDPASAAAMAGYRRAVEIGAIQPDALAVLILTSSGFKWPDAMAEVFPAQVTRGVDELHTLLSRLSGQTAAADDPATRGAGLRESMTGGSHSRSRKRR